MAHIHGFLPVADVHARVLILGSMPSRLSLKAAQYYAHPRNLFWTITAELLEFDADAAYEKKLHLLRAHNIALWDVMKTCTRHSSLDSDIVTSSIVINDFPAFFDQHPNIKSIFFNGIVAATAFAKQTDTRLVKKIAHMQQRRLPSTSPANATLSYEKKIAAWQTIVQSR